MMITVAADGTADYIRIQEAIDSLAEEREWKKRSFM